MDSSKEKQWERILFQRRGGSVIRWHACRPWIGREQSVAEHTFNMLGVISAMLSHTHLTNDVRHSFMFAAVLRHDLGEQVTGDVPSPLKWALVRCGYDHVLEHTEKVARESYDWDLWELTPSEVEWLNIADFFEAAITLIEQFLQGNRFASHSAKRLEKKLIKLPIVAQQFSFYAALRNTLREVAEANHQGRFLQAFANWSAWELFETMAPERIGADTTGATSEVD